MYNLFYIESLGGSVDGGYIEDYDGDGIEDLVFDAVNNSYMVGYYRNGEIQKNTIPYVNYDETPAGMKTPFYTYDVLPQKCLEKAIEYGFTANRNFTIGSSSHIGYVKTKSLTGTLNLRSAPSTDSEVITQLPNGLLFHVTPDENGNYDVFSFQDWYHVSVFYNDMYYTGYVSADYAIAWDNNI